MAASDEDPAASTRTPTAGATSTPTADGSSTTAPPPPASSDKTADATTPAPPAADANTIVEYDDFGLPLRRAKNTVEYAEEEQKEGAAAAAADKGGDAGRDGGSPAGSASPAKVDEAQEKTEPSARNGADANSSSDEEEFKDAMATPSVVTEAKEEVSSDKATDTRPASSQESTKAVGTSEEKTTSAEGLGREQKPKDDDDDDEDGVKESMIEKPESNSAPANAEKDVGQVKEEAAKTKEENAPTTDWVAMEHKRDSLYNAHTDTNGIGEYSHQQMALPKKEDEEDGDGGWQTMPAFAPYDMYDDDNKLIAREHHDDEDETYNYAGMGGAGKGYTRVLVDDDAESATSMDENTNYLFKTAAGTSMMDDEDTRDAVSQMQATKDLLTEGQKIAYVGLVRIALSQMVKEMEKAEASAATSKSTKKAWQLATEAMKMWSQKIMIRLYSHMDISAAEQVMIEQLSEHGVIASDLTPQLMANARVKNPMAEEKDSTSGSRPSSVASPQVSSSGFTSPRDGGYDSPLASPPLTSPPLTSPPAYDKHEGEELPAVRTPNQLPTSDKLDIDIRWTILCDLFLVLIADSIYDARSRVLFERVGKALEIDWVDICRFEKKVTEALEMQQAAERENWNEDEHMENRRKLALKKRYIVMGLATVGGGLVIGLSAGLLAPVIGAGLAAGFTTIGVTGTSSFLAGAGGAAIITASSATSGSIIGARAANRRTGSVKTFEYRPLHNNKRVNLIVTISGWMTGKVDDVRLPFSTVDPVMGDMYSVLWEPEMLTSMGDTINILATEALTQGLQQVLGSTILVSLMAALQLPVVLTKLSYLIDNPWSVSLDRAWAAGLILADSLVERNLGTRPITLVGYSLGSRVIFSCLLELARKGALGLIQNVYMFGSPIVVKQEEYLKIRTVVAGRVVNGYHRNDWILGYLFRLTNGGIRRVAGLAPVDDVPELENVDCSEFVAGHMDYRRAMPRLMRECGWLVESDEFTEIEDPDPENHTQRQRELINEIEEARKELEKGGAAPNRKSGAFGGFFSRKKKAKKAEWEVYEDSKAKAAAASAAGGAGASVAPSGNTEDREGNNHGVLFDVDAIRAELARSADDDTLQPRELKSTLPPMKIPSPGLPLSPRDSLSHTKSMDASLYTTTHPSSKTPSFDYGRGYHDDDGGVQMTFDNGFADEEPHRPGRSQTLLSSTTDDAVSRPEFKTAQTVPTIATSSNPWADADDDDDFGKEKEISMTFA